MIQAQEAVLGLRVPTNRTYPERASWCADGTGYRSWSTLSLSTALGVGVRGLGAGEPNRFGLRRQGGGLSLAMVAE